MKIGIVSIHSAHNYGSVLQAYALQESLKKYSDEVNIAYLVLKFIKDIKGLLIKYCTLYGV